jgi:hypothetical protein
MNAISPTSNPIHLGLFHDLSTSRDAMADALNRTCALVEMMNKLFTGDIDSGLDPDEPVISGLALFTSETVNKLQAAAEQHLKVCDTARAAIFEAATGVPYPT